MGRILFKKAKAYAQGDIDANVHSCDEWYIMPTSHVFDVGKEQKDLPKNDWLDEHGDDEFVPDEPIYKAFEDEIEFAFKGGDDFLEYISNFIHYLSHGGVFSMYDEHTKVGFENVRFVKYDPEADFIKEEQEVIIKFKVTFKINSPQSNIVLNK